MKTTLQAAMGIVLGGVLLFLGKALVWKWMVESFIDEAHKETSEAVARVNESLPRYKTVTEVVKPRTLRECQVIYGEEVNEVTRTCMEGSVLTVRVNEKTGERQILKREKYYHLEKQNVL